MRKCESITYVDQSILCLPKLETLDLGECSSLKTLGSNICSQYLRVLHLAESGLKELPPSFSFTNQLSYISVTINYGLVDLPENVARFIVLCKSINKKDDNFSILQKAFPCPVFRSLKGLVFQSISLRATEIPDNISLLSSLQYLGFLNCTAIKSLPESINYLTRLTFLEVWKCKKLQCIPALPPSIQYLHVRRCQSLQRVLCSVMKPVKRPIRVFVLSDCLKLDDHSYDAILNDALSGLNLHS
ncbi:hypothetical protein Fmac_012402 [Flemingia macrophylla]|uniref:At1g61320/AtMIF1 LRR domain-containing protein n=1 Tax=Flemingia macrophylla TaxID=520843 RepID=A0ABD1MQ81_9FABA